MGLVDVTDCYYGFPISLSFPHFMDGEKHLQTDITGLEPNKEKHSSEFIIQPVSWEQALEQKTLYRIHTSPLMEYQVECLRLQTANVSQR